MKVFITGGSGLIGSALVNAMVRKGHDVSYSYLNNNLGGNTVRMDVSDRQGVLEAVGNTNPDIIMHTAATTSADLCETEPQTADGINVEGTRNVVEAAQLSKARIVFVSSAFVFDGTKEVYYEDDETKPINYYGKTKLEAEKIVQGSGQPFLIARTDQLYGWTKGAQKQNSVVKALQNLKQGKECREPTDWLNCPTLADNLAEVIVALIEKNKEGVYHTVGSDFISRYEWMQRVAEVFGFDRTQVQPISAEKFNLAAKRPNANLSNTKAERDSGIKLIGVEEGAERMKSTEE